MKDFHDVSGYMAWIGNRIGGPYTPPAHFRTSTIVRTATIMSTTDQCLEHAEAEAEAFFQPSQVGSHPVE